LANRSIGVFRLGGGVDMGICVVAVAGGKSDSLFRQLYGRPSVSSTDHRRASSVSPCPDL
jgi:hypothetical protein